MKEEQFVKKNTSEFDIEGNPLVFYQNNFGLISPFISQDILYWCSDIGEELVLEAMKRALQQNRQWGYAIKILKAWHQKNIRTLADVTADDIKFENGRLRAYSHKPNIRKEIVPNWLGNSQPPPKEKFDQVEHRANLEKEWENFKKERKK